jgi:hypothetical protein
MTASPSARIAAVVRGRPPLAPEQHAAAVALLADMLAAADRHGITLADLDLYADLPAVCVQAVRGKTRG